MMLFRKFSNNGLPGKPLYGLMVNCFLIASHGGMFFLSERRHHQQCLWHNFDFTFQIEFFGAIRSEDIPWKPQRLFIWSRFCNPCCHLLIMTIMGSGIGRPLLNLDANWFTMIKINLSLTWNQWSMISVVLSELEYHLLISSLGQFVIYYYITCFYRHDFLQIISM